MKKIFSGLTGIVGLISLADVCVEDITIATRQPWNGLIDISYTIASDSADDDVYVNPVGFNGDTGLTVFMAHLSGDGADGPVKPGRHTITWDSKADLNDYFATRNFKVQIYAGLKLSRYIVIDISGGPEAETYPIRHSVAGPDLSDDTCRTAEIWMRLVPPSVFMMGSRDDEVGRGDDETLHKVTLTKPYYMGVFEITRRQWDLVKDDTLAFQTNDGVDSSMPVRNVAYDALKCAHKNDYYGSYKIHLGMDEVSADSFLGRLRSKTRCAGFDLPTEAQWENACRLGVLSAKYDGRGLTGVTGDDGLELLCHYVMNSGGTVAKVGSYQANAYGLYDMLGNVREMCREKAFYSYGTESVIDPAYYWTLEYGYNYLIVRGGGKDSPARECRAACRSKFEFFWARADAPTSVNHYYGVVDVGFRLMATGSLQD